MLFGKQVLLSGSVPVWSWVRFLPDGEKKSFFSMQALLVSQIIQRGNPVLLVIESIALKLKL